MLYFRAYTTILGLSVLYCINPRTAMFAAVSIFIYTSIYTPLKQKHHFVFTGAIPGAIPFMLGQWPTQASLALNQARFL